VSCFLDVRERREEEGFLNYFVTIEGQKNIAGNSENLIIKQLLLIKLLLMLLTSISEITQ